MTEIGPIRVAFYKNADSIFETLSLGFQTVPTFVKNKEDVVPLSLLRPYLAEARRNDYDDLFARFSCYGRGKANPQRIYLPVKGKHAAAFDCEIGTGKDILLFLGSLFASYFDSPNLFENDAKLCKPAVGLRSAIAYLRSISTSSALQYYNEGYFEVPSNGKMRQVRIGKFLTQIGEHLKLAEQRVQALIDSDGAHARTFSTYGPGNIIWREWFQTRQRLVEDHIAAFQSDPNRKLVRDHKYWVVVSRHPLDIATMSTGRGWRSCTNLRDGGERCYVIEYIRGGSLVAYMIKDGDWNIQNPVSRVIIARQNGERHNKNYVFKQLSTYGTRSSVFSSKVETFCKIVNRGKPDGVYRTPPRQQYSNIYRKSGNQLSYY